MEERKSRYEQFIEEDEAPKTKQCSKCHKVKALSEYHKRAGRGVVAACKDCVNGGRRKYKSREDRFWKTYWAKVHKVGECLEWAPSRHKSVNTTWNGQKILLRRLVYQLTQGTLSDADYIISTCNNHRCVRQSHLKKVSYSELEVKWRNSAPTGDRHSTHTKPESYPRGEKHRWAILTEADVLQIRDLYAHTDMSLRELANHYEVSIATVHLVTQGKNWAHVGGPLTETSKQTHPRHIARGERIAQSTLTESDVLKVWHLRADGMTGEQIASLLGVTRSAVSSILCRRRWVHVVPPDVQLPNTRARGERSGRSKLTEVDIREIRSLYETRKFTNVELGRRFGVSDTMIRNIVDRKSWVHVQ